MKGQFIYLCFFTFFTFVSTIFAQNPEWIVYNTENSDLSENYVTCIAIDDSGNKWIGTEGSGLAKFDGSSWTVYNTDNSGLPENYVSCVTFDDRGNKWIGSIGLAVFDDSNWTVYDTENSSLPSNGVRCIAIDGSGNKWIVSSELAMFDGSNWTIYNTYNSGLPSDCLTSIAIDGSGNKWIGTDNMGLTMFDGSNWTVYDTDNSGLPENYVSCVTFDDRGNKWIGSIGLAVFDDSNWTVYNTENSGLPGDLLTSIAIDGRGNKWIGTSIGGGSLYDDPVGTGLTVYNEGGVINYIKQDKELLVAGYSLQQNYPNPFNPKTIINYKLPARSAGGPITNYVELSIYNLLGQKVLTLVSEKQSAGYHEVEFNGQDLSSGVYLYRIQAGEWQDVKKMILLR